MVRGQCEGIPRVGLARAYVAWRFCTTSTMASVCLRLPVQAFESAAPVHACALVAQQVSKPEAAPAVVSHGRCKSAACFMPLAPKRVVAKVFLKLALCKTGRFLAAGTALARIGRASAATNATSTRRSRDDDELAPVERVETSSASSWTDSVDICVASPADRAQQLRPPRNKIEKSS